MIEEYKKTILEQADELRKLRGWVSDLQSQMYVNCTYCGHRFGRDDQVPASMADVLKQHIAVCPLHPMSKLIRAATGAGHLIASLLAVREGATDELLRGNLNALNEALRFAGAAEVRS